MEAFNQSGAPLTQAEMIKTAKTTDEDIKLCPLCHSKVKLFFINFDEKVFICKNFDCVYPFGYEEVTYVKVDNGRDCSEAVASTSSEPTFESSPTCSESSDADWTDIAKMSCVIEMHKINNILKNLNTCNEKLIKSENILKNVEAIKKIQVQISEKEGEKCLWIERWIGNLISELEEVNLLRKSDIDINRETEEGSLIKIEIEIKPEL